MHSGEVLAYDKEKGQHLVFYDDGEDEWVDLLAQPVTWQEHVRGVTIAHGLPAGEPWSLQESAQAQPLNASQGSIHIRASGWHMICRRTDIVNINGNIKL